MGILSASCSFTRFKITEPVPKELWMEIPAKLRQFAFQDIDDIAEERGWGWTSFEDMLDMQWRSAPPEKGAYLAFALRLDTRRIPPAVLKKYVTIALREEEGRIKEQGKKVHRPGSEKRTSGSGQTAPHGAFSPHSGRI